jgi:predicted TIM-barrel fold metal-dependent hydrolase
VLYGAQGDGKEDHTYLLEQFAQDVDSSHHTLATVYVECHNAYRDSGPAAFKPVGETEFAAAIGAASDASRPGKARICAGIVSSADLSLGAPVRTVLEAHMEAGQGRFRGVRATAGYDPDPIIGNTSPVPGVYLRPQFRQGVAELTALGLSLDAWVFFHQLGDLIDLAHIPLTQTIWQRALAKAEEAYGDAVRTDLGKALERLQQREGWLERCRQVLAIEAPRAALWQRLLNLQRLAAAPSAPARD